MLCFDCFSDFKFFLLNVFADNDDFVGWTWKSSTTSLRIQIFSSASSFQSKISDNFFAWNGIDSNVKIASCTYRSDDDDLKYEIQFKGSQLTGTTMATTGIYTRGFLGIGWSLKNFWTFTGEVEKAIITLDTRSSDGLLSQSNSRQVKTIIHELGHTLALDHPDCGSTAIMQQGYTLPAALNIQTHDRDNLRAKW